jgi:hypothetical protein
MGDSMIAATALSLEAVCIMMISISRRLKRLKPIENNCPRVLTGLRSYRFSVVQFCFPDRKVLGLLIYPIVFLVVEALDCNKEKI